VGFNWWQSYKKRMNRNEKLPAIGQFDTYIMFFNYKFKQKEKKMKEFFRIELRKLDSGLFCREA